MILMIGLMIYLGVVIVNLLAEILGELTNGKNTH